MSKIAVNEITDEVGTGAPAFPNGMSVTGAALTDPEITGGIFLGGTGSANKLDDYEEGTWTPVWSFSGGGSVTIDSGVVATYIKIGNLVHLIYGAKISSVSSPSGNATLTGIPFAPVRSGGISLNQIRRFATDFAANLAGNVSSSGIFIRKNSSNNISRVQLQGPDFSASSGFNQIGFSITYETNS